MAKEKPKFAMYWAASCGGCEIAAINIHENILVVDEIFDVVFWPVATDFKYEDVRNYPDGYIDLCLYNGSIRTSENEELAHLLRQKSKVLVAFGSCAHQGGIPSLSNLTTKEDSFNAVYMDNPSIHNPEQHFPQTHFDMPEGEIHIPEFYENVLALDQVVPVDYYIPGCPPEADKIWAVLQVVVGALTKGDPLPPAGSIIGATNVAVCEECDLEKKEKSIERFYRPYEIIPEPGVCLLEQGLICMGPATRGGCGAKCPQVSMGCRGCYGPLDVEDMGAKMLSAIASVIGVGSPDMEEDELDRKIEEVVDTLADPVGTFYRFGMSHSLLYRAKINGSGDGKGETK